MRAHLVADGRPIRMVVEVEVALEQVDDREIRGGLAIPRSPACAGSATARQGATDEFVARRDLPVPGSPITPTTCPRPPSACRNPLVQRRKFLVPADERTAWPPPLPLPPGSWGSARHYR